MLCNSHSTILPVSEDKEMLERKEMTRAVDVFDRFQDSLHGYSALPKPQKEEAEGI